MQEFARGGSEIFRKEHVFARYGGEEFSLLISEADAKAGFEVVECLGVAVEGTPFQTSAGPLPITVSIGVAQLNSAIDTAQSQLLPRADDNLYRAKKNGSHQPFVS